MNADDQVTYKQAVKEFDELRGLLPRFEQQKAFLRPADELSYTIKQWLPPGMRPPRGPVRDAAVCALTNKACNSHAAVRALTDTGNGDDAMILARVIMETTVVLHWILRDRIHRLDLYCLSTALSRRRWLALAREYFSEYPEIVAAAEQSTDDDEAALVRAVFGDTKYRWARERKPDGRFVDFTIEKMVKELASDKEPTSSSHFLYDVIYYMHSAHAHGTTEGLAQFRTLRQRTIFTCELGLNDGQSGLALRGANTFLAWLLQGTCDYLGFDDLAQEIDGWFERLKAHARMHPTTPSRTVT